MVLLTEKVFWLEKNVFLRFLFLTLTHSTSLPLQVCVVSLVGFVMLCILYQPDEKTCVQFTVKVP